MYVTKGKKISEKTVYKTILKTLNDKWYTLNRKKERDTIIREMGALRESYESASWRWKDVCKNLVDLNNALLSGRPVFAVCEKEPRGNLDTGRHYYSVRFVNKDYSIKKVWLFEFGRYVNQDKSNNHSLDCYIFSSRAIGMSRVLDATDGLFRFLKKCGGCYAQIDVI